jgi:RimJ/RimL family protein N-acetyltransferase
MVDGRGAERVARLMRARSLNLRPAVAGDRDNLFLWRNHEDNRRHSGDGRPIARPAHDAWFSATLADGARKLLIAEDDGVPVGVLRYDIAGFTATVSLYLVPGNGGRGFGEAMLAAGEKWLSRACPGVRALEAAVRPDNLPSMRVFGAAGFDPCSTLFRKKVDPHA